VALNLAPSGRIHLTDLIFHGGKRATPGLLNEYEHEGKEVEFVGELRAHIENDGNHAQHCK
jgi:uncharacterized protein YhfF